MPRKRNNHSDDDGGGLDSLLDTMTNVVGILVLVLIATQLGVQQAVTKAVTDVDKLVTADDLEKAREELAISQEEKKMILAQLENKVEDNTKEIEVKVADLRRTAQQRRQELEKEKQVANTFAMKIEQDKKKAEDARKKIKELEDNKKNRTKIQSEIATSLEKEAELKAILDDTPVTQAPPPKVVTLPDPKPAPEGAKRLLFYCVYNRIYPIQEEAFRTPIKKQLEAFCDGNPRLFKSPGVVDKEKFFQQVKRLQKNWRDDDCTIEVVASGINLNLRFTPKDFERAGANVKEVENSKSRFRKMLSLVDNRKYYAKFIVYPDSYDVYLSARAALAQQNLLAGWEPRGMPREGQVVYHDTWLGSKILFGKKPPPKPVDPNKPPPKPTKPKNEID